MQRLGFRLSDNQQVTPVLWRNFLFLPALVFTALPAAHADVVISSGTTENMTCAAGICAPTARDAVLNVGDLENLLASGNAEVTTTGAGVQAKNVAFKAALSWSNSSTLTLDAFESVSVQTTLTVAGAGGLVVITNDGGKKGTFSFGANDSVTFQDLASPLTINGRNFTLVNSLPALIGAVASNPQGAYALANGYDALQDGTYTLPPIHALNGVLEGLGNAISHLAVTVKHHRYVDTGLVREVKVKGMIENLRLKSVRIRAWGTVNGVAGLVGFNKGNLYGDEVHGIIVATGSSQAAGGIAGYNTGTIEQSSAHVSVTGNADFGGLVGWNTGRITLSHSAGNISGYLVGGLIGQNEGPVSQSFSTATVTGAEAGGLVGSNTTDAYIGTIENSYARGAIGGSQSGGFVSQNDLDGPTISSSYSTGKVPLQGGGFACGSYPRDFADDYWNVTTSGASYSECDQVNDQGVTGLTSKQLRKKLPAGFDPKIWALDPKINSGFPYLIANPPTKE